MCYFKENVLLKKKRKEKIMNDVLVKIQQIFKTFYFSNIISCKLFLAKIYILFLEKL